MGLFLQTSNLKMPQWFTLTHAGDEIMIYGPDHMQRFPHVMLAMIGPCRKSIALDTSYDYMFEVKNLALEKFNTLMKNTGLQVRAA
jgi:hypothetical protein